MTNQYKTMEQKLQQSIRTLTGEVEDQEKSMAAIKEEINQLNNKKE